MSTRIKSTTAQPIASRQEFESTVDVIAALQLKIDADVAVHNEQKAATDKAFKAQLKRDQEKLLAKLNAAEIYAEANREALIGDKQTAETKLSYYGYRKSPGVIKALNSKWNAAKTLLALKAAQLTACIKTTETLDKNAIKKHIAEPELPKYGLRMEYREDFWIEPKRAEKPTEKRLTTATP